LRHARLPNGITIRLRNIWQLPSLTKFGEAFGLIAKGDSMAPYINPYDVLICVDKPDMIKDRTAVVCVFKSVDTIEANAKLIKRDKKARNRYALLNKHQI
jgi:phage repressor protein C with HTH and peptisase S24 domain